MKDRGLPVTVMVTGSPPTASWDAVGARQRGTGEERERNIREKLRAFRRQGSSPTGEEL